MRDKCVIQKEIEILKGEINKDEETISHLEKELEILNKTYRVGQWFEVNDGTKAVLAQVDYKKVALICFGVEDANRWHEPVNVTNTYHITEEEFNLIAGNAHISKIDTPKELIQC